MAFARLMLLLDEPESSAARSMVMAGFKVGVSMELATLPFPISPLFKFAIRAPTIARSLSLS